MLQTMQTLQFIKVAVMPVCMINISNLQSRYIDLATTYSTSSCLSLPLLHLLDMQWPRKRQQQAE